MRLRRLALAFSSCTKAQTERLNADNNMPFIPISIPACRYPMRIPVNRGLSSYARSLSSLTRLERVKTPGCAEARRKRGKRIPFFRCNTLSTLNLRIAVSSGSDLTPSVEFNRNFTDETTKPIIRKKSSRDQLSKHIKHLRGKFGSVSEENHSSNRNSDTDLIQSFAINSKEKKNCNEIKTSIMASLLIGSIRNMPLENVGTDNFTSIVSSDEQLTTTNNDEVSEAYCTENSQENEEIKNERQRQDNTSIDETEISSFYDGDNSSGDESSDGTTSYNILDDSRYSLDDDRTADSSSLQERIPITIRSSAESCTDSTLQVDSDVAMNCQLSSNSDIANTEDIELRNNVIPVITVDIHESADSDTSNNESFNITAKTDIFIPKSISSSDEQEVDDMKCKIDTSEKFKSEKIDNSLHEACHDVHLMTKHEQDPCRLHSNRESAQLEFPSSAEPEDYISIDRKENNLTIDLPHTTRCVSVSKEELPAKAIVAERRRYMRDLIELIDTKMMISTHATHHGKRAVSLRSKKRKREKKMHKKNANISENSLEKIPSHGTPRRHATLHSRRRGEDIPFRVSRVHSIPNYIFSKQQPNVSTSHTISRSCDSSLISLTDYRVSRVSRGSKRSALPPTVPTFDDSSEIPRQLPKSSHSKSDTVFAASVDSGTRKHPSTIYNLKKASCHIDHTKPTNTANNTHNSCVSRPSPDLRQQDEASISPSCPLPAVSSMTVKISQSPATKTLANVPLHRRSSDSDLSVTPKGEFFLQVKNKEVISLLLSDIIHCNYTKYD